MSDVATEKVRRTIAIKNRHIGYAVFDQQMNNIHDWSVHSGRLQVTVGTTINIAQGFAQVLSVFNVDGNKFEDAILCEDADDHSALRLIIDIYKRNASSARLEHSTTGSIQRLERVYRNSLDGLDTNGFFNVAETVEAELVDLGESVGILPVVLNDVDVVGGCQEAGKGRCLGVP